MKLSGYKSNQAFSLVFLNFTAAPLKFLLIKTLKTKIFPIHIRDIQYRISASAILNYYREISVRGSEDICSGENSCNSRVSILVSILTA